MIPLAVKRFDAKRPELLAQFGASPPNSYLDIVRATIAAITGDDGDFDPDPDRITQIDHGDYEGTLLFIIAEKGYQPSRFYAVTVGYGSCSGCDTLCGIQDEPEEDRPASFLTEALHILQNLHTIGNP